MFSSPSCPCLSPILPQWPLDTENFILGWCITTGKAQTSSTGSTGSTCYPEPVQLFNCYPRAGSFFSPPAQDTHIKCCVVCRKLFWNNSTITNPILVVLYQQLKTLPMLASSSPACKISNDPAIFHHAPSTATPGAPNMICSQYEQC